MEHKMKATRSSDGDAVWGCSAHCCPESANVLPMSLQTRTGVHGSVCWVSLPGALPIALLLHVRCVQAFCSLGSSRLLRVSVFKLFGNTVMFASACLREDWNSISSTHGTGCPRDHLWGKHWDAVGRMGWGGWVCLLAASAPHPRSEPSSFPATLCVESFHHCYGTFWIRGFLSTAHGCVEKSAFSRGEKRLQQLRRLPAALVKEK